MTLRVVGAGVGRTGTESLKLALEHLLGGRCYHMLEVLAHPESVTYWASAGRGEMPDWDQVFDGYVAAVDWPVAAYWPELSAAFPDAPVLLSTRASSDEWYRSASQTIFAIDRSKMPGAAEASFIQGMFGRFTFDLGNPQAAIEAYEAHNRNVRESGGPRAAHRLAARRWLGPGLPGVGAAGATRTFSPCEYDPDVPPANGPASPRQPGRRPVGPRSWGVAPHQPPPVRGTTGARTCRFRSAAGTARSLARLRGRAGAQASPAVPGTGLVGRPETRRRKLGSQNAWSHDDTRPRVSGVEFAGSPLGAVVAGPPAHLCPPPLSGRGPYVLPHPAAEWE